MTACSLRSLPAAGPNHVGGSRETATKNANIEAKTAASRITRHDTEESASFKEHINPD